MAKAPPSSSAKKGKDVKSTSTKSRSSASEVNKEKSKSKDNNAMMNKKPFKKVDIDDAPAAPPVKSVLKESRPVPSFNLVQEQDFPRGAPPPSSKASSKAAKAFEQPQEKGLFEDSITKASTSNDTTVKAKRRKSEADAIAGPSAASSATTPKKRKVDNNSSKKSSSSASTSAAAVAAQDSFRVEHLSYKRLLPGPTVLLVQIIAILPLELIVSLPEQLLGHIPITNISSTFTKRLEEDVEASSGEEEEESDNDEQEEADSDAGGEGSGSSDKIPNLTQMFNVGQYLRASVVNVVSGKNASAQLSSSYGAASRRGNEDWKASRRCELTLEPSKVNAGVTFNDLKSGNSGLILQATVKSIEDTGYILDFGINTNKDQSDKSALTSFLPFKGLKPLRKTGDLPPQALTSGGIISTKITKIAENGRTCTVSVSPNEIRTSIVSDASVGLSALIPGTLIQGTISSITPSGLNVKFLGFYEGSVDNLHMLPSTAHTYKVGEKIKARILWTAPPLNDSPIRFSLSTLPHILSLTPKTAPIAPGISNSEVAPIGQVLPIGTFLENLQIIKVEPEWGILCALPGTDLKAFVHISHVSDEHITNLSSHATSGLWKVGSIHKGRVIGYSSLDGLLQASLQKSVLERRFMKVQDLHVGEKIDGIVQRLSDSALFVNIHGNVAGVVWPLHYSDLRLKHPERRFKAGTAVKARILSIDPEKNRVVLTLKRSLVNSDLPLVSTIEEAKPGLIIHAMVQTFINKDMLVETFGGLRAFVPVAEAADHFVENIQKEFNLGQVVKVKLIHVDTEARRLTASVKQALDTYKAPADVKSKKKEKAAQQQDSDYTFSDNVTAIEIGDKVTGEITAIHESQIVLQLKNSMVKALLSISALAKLRKTSVLELKPTLAVGQTISDLAVVSKNPEKGLVIVGLSQPKPGPSLVIEKGGISQATEQPLVTFDSLQEGNILEATIGDQIPVGYFVQISRGIRGKMRWTELSDDYDTVKALDLSKGSKVKCIIVDYDKDEKRIDLSIRRSRLEDVSEEEIRDPVIESIKSLKKDQPVRGFVRGISDNGLFVDIGKNLTARVQIKELFDEYVKDWKPKFTIGQVVDGKIVSTIPAKNQIEMTLRKASFSKKAAKESKEPSITFEGLSVGEVIKGVIKRLEAYGAFIRVEGSTVSGLCHKSKIVDEKNNSKWNEGLNVGDKVRAKIMELDVEKHKIAFSMKPSDLPEEEDDDEDDQEENSVMQKLNHLVELQDAASDEDDDDEDSDDDIRIMMQGLEESDDDEGEDDEEEEEEDADEGASMQEDRPEASTSQAVAAAPLKLSAFKWDGVVETPAEADEDATSEDEEQEELPSKHKTQGILVDDKTGDLASQVPTSPSDFDRLLLASPNSSLLWIQYMSYYLQLGDIEQARSISQRALKTINYREEEERLNIWIASLNLESMHGTDDSFDELFNKAIQTNDAKQVFLRTTEALDASEKLDKAEEIYQRFVKKYNMSSKAWTLYGNFLLRHGKTDSARDLLPRSLKSLPKRKHVKTISQFGLMEFKIGEPERGRTIFEGIVDSYPKRLDLWWIYIDQEIRLKNVLGVRALFDRVLMTKLSSKKTKSVFKKWLAFEKQHGDEVAAEAVKERAIEYVQSLQKDDDDDE